MSNELKLLLVVPDKGTADEIQRLLESGGVYCIQMSDNPASSLMSVYSPATVIENISIKVHRDDFSRAVEIIGETSYSDLLVME